MWNGTGWELADTMHHRMNFAEDVIDLSDHVPAQEGLYVRLRAASHFVLEQVGLDTSPPADLSVQEAGLRSAIHSSGEDVSALLSDRDASYAELVPGQEILLEFEIPAIQDPDMKRSFVLVSQGHYQHKRQAYVGEDLQIMGQNVQISATLAEETAVYYWDVTITSITWQMDDGTVLQGLSVTHTYKEAGEYSLVIEVQYEDGRIATKERRIIVGG